MKELVKKKGYDSLSELIVKSCIGKDVLYSEQRCMSSEKLNDRIFIRVTKEEKQEMSKKAEKAGLKFSRYVRNACLSENIIVINGFKEFARELNKVGVNLNQIARLCNEGLIQCPDINEVKEELQKIYKELTRLMKKSQPGR